MDRDDDSHSLTGCLLVAMPQMQDPRFARTVIYMCVHSPEGAMGLVVNRVLPSLSFPDLLEQLEIGLAPGGDEIRVHFGGPVESVRGFVLHSADYVRDGTVVVALGYAGWGPGQLDGELQRNAWLHVPADEDLIFDDDIDKKWERAAAKLGIALSHLSSQAGHA
jgi:putative transcriptional regulator